MFKFQLFSFGTDKWSGCFSLGFLMFDIGYLGNTRAALGIQIDNEDYSRRLHFMFFVHEWSKA